MISISKHNNVFDFNHDKYEIPIGDYESVYEIAQALNKKYMYIAAKVKGDSILISNTGGALTLEFKR